MLESLYKLRVRESVQLKTVLEMYDMEIHRFSTVKSWKQWWRGEKIRNFDYETLTQDTGELKQEQQSRIGREWVALKVSFTSGKKKASIRKENNAVSGMRETIVHKNQTTMPPHFLSHPCHQVEVFRERSIRGKSNHGAILRQPCRFYLKGACTRPPCE